MKGLALFDFDGTLIEGDSFISFGIHAAGRARFYGRLLLCSPWLAAWKAGLIPGGRAKERLFGSLFAGMPAEDFRRYCRSFMPVIERSLRHDVIKKMQAHRRRGDRLVIVSASPKDWIEPWARTVGVDEIISTGVEVKDGRLTGRFSTPNCVGDEKVRRVKELIPDLADYEVYAYGDSRSDEPMLGLAGPRAQKV